MSRPATPADILAGASGAQGRRLSGLISQVGLLLRRFVRKPGRLPDHETAPARVPAARGATLHIDSAAQNGEMARDSSCIALSGAVEDSPGWHSNEFSGPYYVEGYEANEQSAVQLSLRDTVHLL